MNLLVTALTALSLAAGLVAQDTREPAAKAATNRAPFVFEAGEVELRELIQRCGAYLQRNILIDDNELVSAPNPNRGRARPAAPAADAAAATGPIVELQLPVVTDRDGCEELLAGLLWRHGLAIVPLDESKGVYEVLAINGQRQREIMARAVQRTPEQVLQRPTLRQCVTVVASLQHTNAVNATNALRPFFANYNSNPGTAGLTLGNVGNPTSVLISGPQDMVASALLLLQAADVPPPPELRTDVDQRLDALARQNEELLQRIAALEQSRR